MKLLRFKAVVFSSSREELFFAILFFLFGSKSYIHNVLLFSQQKIRRLFSLSDYPTVYCKFEFIRFMDMIGNSF